MSGNHLSPPDAPEAPDHTNHELLLAEAEAEAAEATAEAARARARAARLRRRAGAGSVTDSTAGDTEPVSAEPDATTKLDTSATGTDENSAPVEPATADEPASGGTDADSAVPVSAASPVAADSEAPDIADTGRDDRKRRLRRLPIALPRISRRAAGVTVAALVLCAGLSSSGYIMWRHHDVTAEQHRQAEFVAAARQGVTSLTSLDFNHAADDVKRVLDDSTGTFRDDFQTRADDFAKVIQQSQVATEGHVNSTAVQSMTDDSAVVLVAATSKVTNSAGAKQEPRAWRLSVTVQRVDGQLEMSKVEFVP